MNLVCINKIKVDYFYILTYDYKKNGRRICINFCFVLQLFY